MEWIWITGENTSTGIIGIFNEGKNIEDMRRLANELLDACDKRILDADNMAEPEEDDDNEK